MRERETPSDIVRLQTEVMRYRARLVDPETSLPTLAFVMDEAREMLTAVGTAQIFVFRIEQEQLLEGVVGWEMYDRFMRYAAEFLRELVLPDGILCLENVRSDVFIVISTSPKLAGRLQDTLSAGIPIDTGSPAAQSVFPVRIGQGRVWRSPAVRLERCLYNGLLEARRDFHLRGQMLDESRRADLRKIIKTRAISSLFQPILRLPDLQPEGYEALSRGPRDSYFESAENLFGFAERFGLLGEVEQLCIEKALNEGDSLPSPRTLFINLSIHGLEFIETAGGRLVNLVNASTCVPENFVLEITERTYSENPELLRKRVNLLRGYGFRIAIDDMGTGFSSLNVLAELEPEYIKLDHTLVRDLANKPIKRNLVAAISSFASNSNSRVIAEGVEGQADLDALTDLGIELVQGFFFGLPKPAAEFLPVTTDTPSSQKSR